MQSIGKMVKLWALCLTVVVAANTVEIQTNADVSESRIAREHIAYAKTKSSSKSIVQYTKVNQQTHDALQYAWDLLNTYAVGSNYLNDPYVSGSDGYYSYEGHMLTTEQYAELSGVAQSITEGLSTDYEKIETVMKYVANNLYYDMDYYNGKTASTDVHPYDVWTSKISVCAGYARLVRTFLISLGIPCMDIYGDNHEYNAAYDRQNGKWIFVDATWACGNQYSAKKGKVAGKYKSGFFDSDIDFISTLKNHEVYNLYDLSMEGGASWLSTDRSNWSDIGKWVIALQTHAGRQTK